MAVSLIRSLLVLLRVPGILTLANSTQPAMAHAGNITGKTLADNANGGDGKCTLREAINNANADEDALGGG